jgi:hypothetical protein
MSISTFPIQSQSAQMGSPGALHGSSLTPAPVSDFPPARGNGGATVFSHSENDEKRPFG